MSQIPTPPLSIIDRLVAAINSSRNPNQGKRFPNANPQSGEQIHPTFDFNSLVNNHLLYGRVIPQNVSMDNAITRRLNVAPSPGNQALRKIGVGEAISGKINPKFGSPGGYRGYV